MSDLNKVAMRSNLVRAHGHGNVQQSREEFTCAAAAENDVVWLAAIPAYSVITDARVMNAALGATNGLTFKLVDSAGSDVSGGALATIADASTAGDARTTMWPLTVEEDVYVVALKTGVGTATGLILSLVQYEYIGN